jgi:hypothetical protein
MVVLGPGVRSLDALLFGRKRLDIRVLLELPLTPSKVVSPSISAGLAINPSIWGCPAGELALHSEP